MRALLRQESPAKIIGGHSPFPRLHQMKTNTMKTNPKYTLAMLSFAMLAAFLFSGCASTGGGSTSGTHEMGPPKSPSRMSNQDMPGR